MFLTVLDALGITADDYGHVVMVGNHLSRDVKGANDLGLMSIWMNWSPRRAKTPLDDSENPDYTITNPSELLTLLENIERNLALKV
jgi:putative hydrolase of the HAD superfamily